MTSQIDPQTTTKMTSQMKSQFLKTFNDQFMQFVEDVILVFPKDPDLILAKNAFIFFRKLNPKVLIDVWYRYVVMKYKKVIEEGDASFFIEKDYNNDVVNLSEWSSKTLEAINRLRGPLKNMNQEEQKKCMKYVQNLAVLSAHYWEN
jgi:hypothetical protein